MQCATYIYLAVLVEVKELVEKVGELLYLEGGEEALELVQVCDIGLLGRIVGSHHGAHPVPAFTNWWRLGWQPECARSLVWSQAGLRGEQCDRKKHTSPLLFYALPSRTV